MSSERTSGHCLMAELAQDEQVTLNTSAEEAHARCPQTNIQGNGTVWVCACRCHAATPFCPRCGEVGVEPDAHTAEECAQVIVEELTARDNHLVSHDVTGALKKALGPEAGAVAPDKPTRPKKSPPKAGGSPCACGCGGTTGGTFCMGHDARLKSQLRGAANDGGIEALAELIVRGWATTAGKLDVDPPAWERAEEIAAHPNVEGWLQRRVEERIDVAS